jgi:hypothetical protein
MNKSNFELIIDEFSGAADAHELDTNRDLFVISAQELEEGPERAVFTTCPALAPAIEHRSLFQVIVPSELFSGPIHENAAHTHPVVMQIGTARKLAPIDSFELWVIVTGTHTSETQAAISAIRKAIDAQQREHTPSYAGSLSVHAPSRSSSSSVHERLRKVDLNNFTRDITIVPGDLAIAGALHPQQSRSPVELVSRRFYHGIRNTAGAVSYTAAKPGKRRPVGAVSKNPPTEARAHRLLYSNAVFALYSLVYMRSIDRDIPQDINSRIESLSSERSYALIFGDKIEEFRKVSDWLSSAGYSFHLALYAILVEKDVLQNVVRTFLPLGMRFELVLDSEQSVHEYTKTATVISPVRTWAETTDAEREYLTKAMSWDEDE